VRASRIIVLTPTRDVVAEAVPDPETGCPASLRPGTYFVDTGRQGIGRSPDAPESVTVHPGGTVRPGFTTDTGMP
jgi:hypothetical protein